MRRLPVLCALLVLAAGAFSSQKYPVYEGTVVSVASGDTIKVKVSAMGSAIDGQEKTVRLWGVESPKPGQPFAKKSKARLSQLALGLKVQVHDWGRDKDSNTVAEVLVYVPSKGSERSYFTEVGGEGPLRAVTLNDEMVASGLATPTKPTGTHDLEAIEKRLQAALESAQKAKRGIWSK